jgi:hypothetical protein
MSSAGPELPAREGCAIAMECGAPPCVDDRHCLVLEGFLDSTICDALCEAFLDLSTRIVNRAPGFWDGRFIWHSDMSSARRELADHMLDASRRAAALITNFYRLTQPIYPDLLQS